MGKGFRKVIAPFEGWAEKELNAIGGSNGNLGSCQHPKCRRFVWEMEMLRGEDDIVRTLILKQFSKCCINYKLLSTWNVKIKSNFNRKTKLNLYYNQASMLTSLYKLLIKLIIIYYIILLFSSQAPAYPKPISQRHIGLLQKVLHAHLLNFQLSFCSGRLSAINWGPQIIAYMHSPWYAQFVKQLFLIPL